MATNPQHTPTVADATATSSNQPGDNNDDDHILPTDAELEVRVRQRMPEQLRDRRYPLPASQLVWDYLVLYGSWVVLIFLIGFLIWIPFDPQSGDIGAVAVFAVFLGIYFLWARANRVNRKREQDVLRKQNEWVREEKPKEYARLVAALAKRRPLGAMSDDAEQPLQTSTLTQQHTPLDSETTDITIASSQTIFVSHSHQDNEFCQDFVQTLRVASANVWYDESDMTEGELLRKIQPEVYNRPIFVLILSEAALYRSNWVNTESQWGYGRYMQDRENRRFLPVTGAPLSNEDFGPNWVFLQDMLRIEGPNRTPLPPSKAAQRVLAVISQIKSGEAGEAKKTPPSPDESSTTPITSSPQEA